MRRGLSMYLETTIPVSPSISLMSYVTKMPLPDAELTGLTIHSYSGFVAISYWTAIRSFGIIKVCGKNLKCSSPKHRFVSVRSSSRKTYHVLPWVWPDLRTCSLFASSPCSSENDWFSSIELEIRRAHSLRLNKPSKATIPSVCWTPLWIRCLRESTAPIKRQLRERIWSNSQLN